MVPVLGRATVPPEAYDTVPVFGRRTLQTVGATPSSGVRASTAVPAGRGRWATTISGAGVVRTGSSARVARVKRITAPGRRPGVVKTSTGEVVMSSWSDPRERVATPGRGFG